MLEMEIRVINLKVCLNAWVCYLKVHYNYIKSLVS